MTEERFYKDSKGLYLIKEELFIQYDRIYAFDRDEDGLMSVRLKIADKLIVTLFQDEDKSVFYDLSNR